ncbi:MAG: sugar transporter [Pseudomonadota bacterium]|nr:sugar transporter [Pseudomonadota bacterium]
MSQPSVRPLNAGPRSSLPEGFPTLVPGTRSTPARAARWHGRHTAAIFSFVLLVLLPLGLSGWYLITRAADQYSTHLGFVVHTEDPSVSPLSALPIVAAFGGSPSPDADILEAYLTSQSVVAAIDARFDLRSAWSRPYEKDPVFAFEPKGTIEDLHRYWSRMVTVTHDRSSGLIDVEIRGFDPDRTQAIGFALQDLGSALINRIGNVAREDRLRQSDQELRLAENRLSRTRQALTTFRLRHRIVDPLADLQGDMQVIHQLQLTLAEERIALDLLKRNMAAGPSGSRQGAIADSRVIQAERRIAAIEDRIAKDRQAFGDAGGKRDLARLVGEYEEKVVAVELARENHAMALAAHEANRAAANLQSRYLASYAPPTRAESAVYPRRWSILAGVGLAAMLIWSTTLLMGYGLRDRA